MCATRCGPWCGFSTIAAVGFLAAACSPYVYDTEVGLFREGVNDSVASFAELKGQERERRIAKRDEQLMAARKPAFIADECSALRRRYEVGFRDGGRNVLTEADYQTCKVTPPEEQIDPFLPNLSAIGEALQAYADGLDAVTNADDVESLQAAFTEFNTSVNDMRTALNKELDEEGQARFDAVANLVYQVGITYLNQRRFNALKKGVNEADPIVQRAAGLLAEAAFDIHGPVISAQERQLAELEDATDQAATSAAYLAAWQALQDGRDAYVELYRASLVGAFQHLADAHAALRQSLNDPGNQDQLDQVLANAKAFRDSAKNVRKQFKKKDDEGDAADGGS